MARCLREGASNVLRLWFEGPLLHVFCKYVDCSDFHRIGQTSSWIRGVVCAQTLETNLELLRLMGARVPSIVERLRPSLERRTFRFLRTSGIGYATEETAALGTMSLAHAFVTAVDGVTPCCLPRLLRTPPARVVGRRANVLHMGRSCAVCGRDDQLDVIMKGSQDRDYSSYCAHCIEHRHEPTPCHDCGRRPAPFSVGAEALCGDCLESTPVRNAKFHMENRVLDWSAFEDEKQLGDDFTFVRTMPPLLTDFLPECLPPLFGELLERIAEADEAEEPVEFDEGGPWRYYLWGTFNSTFHTLMLFAW